MGATVHSQSAKRTRSSLAQNSVCIWFQIVWDFADVIPSDPQWKVSSLEFQGRIGLGTIAFSDEDQPGNFWRPRTCGALDLVARCSCDRAEPVPTVTQMQPW